MHKPPAARLPLVWRRSDPEPDSRITRVIGGPSWWQQWTRVRPKLKHAPEYCWSNTDRLRPWSMLRGWPMFNAERLSYGRRMQRHRRGRYWPKRRR